jgi:hypothetical protein
VNETPDEIGDAPLVVMSCGVMCAGPAMKNVDSGKFRDDAGTVFRTEPVTLLHESFGPRESAVPGESGRVVKGVDGGKKGIDVAGELYFLDMESVATESVVNEVIAEELIMGTLRAGNSEEQLGEWVLWRLWWWREEGKEGLDGVLGWWCGGVGDGHEG